MPRFNAPLVCVTLMMFVSVNWASAAAKSKIKPAKANTQWVQVSTPYCDTYQPYTYPGGNALGVNVLQSAPAAWTVTDPISANGSFNDPGTKILGRSPQDPLPSDKSVPPPDDQFSSDGSDLTRLLTRLLRQNTEPQCKEAGPHATPSQTGQTAEMADKIQYVLVHVVHWEKKKDETYTYSTSNSEWYVFNRSDKKAAHRQFPFTFHPLVSSDLRMFGSSKVFFLAVHLAPVGLYDDFKKNMQINYKVTVKKVEPANVQDFKTLLSVLGLPEQTEKELVETLRQPKTYDGIYGAAQLTGLEQLPVQITPEMNAKLPMADDKAGDAYGSGPHTDSTKKIKTKSADATQKTGQDATGCAIQKKTAATPSATQTGDCTENVILQDEGLYWWDVSVGVPFKSYKDVQVSNGSVTTTTISKQTAYGFLMLAPWKEDIITPPSLGIPHILMGVPFTGKVLDSPFVGLGETINLTKLPGIGDGISKFISNLSIRFYAGLSENKVFGPATLAGMAGPVKWVGKLQYGIEFSIKDVKSKLTGSGSGNGS